MKRIHLCWHCLRAALGKIHLVDKCLILFMLVLLSQSAYTLFSFSASDDEVRNIDIIVRTSSAAIFGYFLSANFIRHATSPNPKQSKTGQPKEVGTCHSCQSDLPRNKIGFEASAVEKPTQLEHNEASLSTSSEENADIRIANRLQIIAATFIGLFCLLSLLFLRNTSVGNSEVFHSTEIAATIAQFRDFVSGCVGFLIGCPTHSNNKPNS